MDYNSTQTALDLGLYYQDYNFLMGLSGLTIGVVFVFSILSLIINFSRR